MSINPSNAWIMAGFRRTLDGAAARNLAHVDAPTIPAPKSEPTPAEPSSARPVVRMGDKRPRPYVRKVARDSAEIAWSPEAIELYTEVGGERVRAGEAFAIVRPGYERWPLGIASDHYRVTPHSRVDAEILGACGDLVTPNGIVMSGHGYHVAFGYVIRHMQAALFEGKLVTSKLLVSHDHTGSGAMRASMSLYLDNAAIGAIVFSRALHVGAQPEIWQANISAMIEMAIIAQDGVLELLRAAKARTLTDEDRSFLKKRGMTTNKNNRTALDALIAYHAGTTRRITWGVWERRLSDDGIRTVVALLGMGKAMDQALTLGGLRNLPCKPFTK